MENDRNEPLQCYADGIPYQVWQEPNLRWLQAYGTVFWIYDQGLDGTLCFGVNGPYGKLFIRYAGAQTVNYRGSPSDAVARLYQSAALYNRTHPALIRLLAHGPAGDGYAEIFPWTDLRPLSEVSQKQVRRLPLIHCLAMLDSIYDLHASLALDGIIASNFHDGHVMIDFGTNTAFVSNIDEYRKKPAVNDKGRMLGDSMFMAPEEYVLNAALDETTMLYNMGALAFAFFGKNSDRTKKTWVGPLPLLKVAQRATQEAKSSRYPSMRSFLNAWRDAVGQCRV